MAYSLADLITDAGLPATDVGFGDAAVQTYLDKGSTDDTSIQEMEDRANSGSVSFSLAAYSVSEDAGSVNITINRTGGSTGTISGDVQVVYSSGNPTVIDTQNRPFSMADGVVSDSVNITLTDNGSDDPDAVADLNFINLSRTQASGITTATLTAVDDDDATPETSITSSLSATISEGNSYTLTITRTGSTASPITVDLDPTNNGTTEGVDYDTLPATMTIDAGQVSESLVIDVLLDGTQDAGESFDLVISNPTVGTINGSADTAVITITDVAEASTVAMTVSSQNVDEGDNAVISVTRTGTYGACSVFVQTAVGTADSGQFEVANKQISWADGETGAKTTSFTTTDDLNFEGNETFTATLNTPSGCTISGTSVTTVTIVDDDFVNIDNETFQGLRNTIGTTGTATAAYHLNRNGEAQEEVNTSSGTDATTSTTLGSQWWSLAPDSDIGDDYEVMVSSSVDTGLGTETGDAVDTWIAISSDRVWGITLESTNGLELDDQRVLTVQIRDAATQTVRDTATITMNVQTFGI